MDYYTLIDKISNAEVVDLLKSQTIDWSTLLERNPTRVFRFSESELKEANFSYDVFGLRSIYTLLGSKNPYILKAVDEYFEIKGPSCIKEIADTNNEIINLFLAKHPEKKDELVNSAKFNGQNGVIFSDKSWAEIADYIGKNDPNPSQLKNLLEHRNEPHAPVNTLIRDKVYAAHNYRILFQYFPRDIPFSRKMVENLLSYNRDVYSSLPLENQIDMTVINYATNNSIDDGVYCYTDPKNIPKNKIPASILDHIDVNQNGCNVAQFFLSISPAHFNHPNIQKIVADPNYTPYFEKYKNLLSKQQQEQFFPIYTIDTIPDSYFSDLKYDQAYRQSIDVLLKICAETDNDNVFYTAIYPVMTTQEPFKVNPKIRDILIGQKFDLLNVTNLHGNHSYNLKPLLLKLVLDTNSIDYTTIAKVLSNNDYETQSKLEKMVEKKLTARQQIEYLQQTQSPNKRKPF